MKDIVAAIDGGGSGTRARLYEMGTRRIIGEGMAGPSSLTFGVESAWASIQAAIKVAFAEYQTSCLSGKQIITCPSKIVAGVAGSRNRSLRTALQALIPEGTEMIIVSDAYTSALGAHAGSPGITVSIGTGLAACRIDADYQPLYTSGWGFKVGDEGAGSWIGLQAVQAYLKQLDGRQQQSSRLYNKVAKTVGREAADIQQWCRQAMATDFAALAKPVVTLAAEQDAVALAIIRDAVVEIELAITAIDDPARQLPIAVLGGLGESLSPYLSAVIRARIVTAAGSALDGAAQIVLGDCPAERHD